MMFKNIKNHLNSPRRISIMMGILKFLRAGISVITLVLSAKYFGLTFERDAWVIAMAIPTVILQSLFGPVNEIFRAKYIYIREQEGHVKAEEVTSSLCSFFSIIAILIIAACIIYPQFFSNIFAPGYKSGKEQIALIFMIQITIPFLLFNELVALWTSVLNSAESFLIPDIYNLLSGLIGVVLLIVLVPFIGIYSLIVSVYIAILPLVVILFRQIHKKKICLRFKIPSFSEIRPFLIFALPFYLSYIVGQVNGACEKAFCTNLGEGCVSILDYARNFVNYPQTIFMTVVFSILTPLVAKFFIQKKKEEYQKEIRSFLRLALLIFLPIVIIFCFCSKEIISLFLLHGRFDANKVSLTANTLSVFGVGLIGIIFYSICGQMLVALNKAKQYAFWAIAGQVLILLLNILFYKRYGVVFFAFSWSSSMILSGFVMFILLPINKVLIRQDVLKLLMMYLIIGVGVYFIHNLLQNYGNFISLAIVSCFIGIAMLGLLFLLKIEERSVIMNYFKR